MTWEQGDLSRVKALLDAFKKGRFDCLGSGVIELGLAIQWLTDMKDHIEKSLAPPPQPFVSPVDLVVKSVKKLKK